MVGIENLTETVAGTYTMLTLNNHIWRNETLIKDFRWPISEVILDNKPSSSIFVYDSQCKWCQQQLKNMKNVVAVRVKQH